MTNAASNVEPMEELERVLCKFMSAINARSVLRLALRRTGISEDEVRTGRARDELIGALSSSVTLYVNDRRRMEELTDQLRALMGTGGDEDNEADPVVMEIREEADIVRVRAKARELARQMGFPHTDQIKVTTAVSELARNIFRYAGEGKVRLISHAGPPESLEIVAEDDGPGIDNLEEILSGGYRSKTGLGRGLVGCRQLSDAFEVDSAPGRGTRVRLIKERDR